MCKSLCIITSRDTHDACTYGMLPAGLQSNGKQSSAYPVFSTLLDAVGEDNIEAAAELDGFRMIRLAGVRAFTEDLEALQWVLTTTAQATTRAILTASNSRVDELNELIQNRNPRPLVELQGATYLKISHLPEIQLCTVSLCLPSGYPISPSPSYIFLLL